MTPIIGSGGYKGISNIMPVKSMKNLQSQAMQSTRTFIEAGKQMNQGASGNSRVSVSA